MFKIKLTARARRELKNISKLHKQAVGSSIEEINQNPFVGKALTREFTGKFSYRIGVLRVIYRINEKDKIVYILTVGHRSKVYQ